uniref:Uncharacterized protein n=1 Tax=Anguilla anguilla TaxID=7936 RepID=A0A0E9V5Z4_ANGAN
MLGSVVSQEAFCCQVQHFDSSESV